MTKWRESSGPQWLMDKIGRVIGYRDKVGGEYHVPQITKVAGDAEAETDPPVSGSLTASLYKSSIGGIALMATKGASVAISKGNKLISFTNVAVPWTYNGTVWAPGSQIGAVAAGVYAMFMDSRGYIFVTITGASVVWRSIDDGLNWTSVYTGFNYTDEHVFNFTEDDRGNLYAGTYGHATASIQLIKSTDGGASWTDIAPTSIVYKQNGTYHNTLASTISKHMHCVHFCPHRKLLFVTHGDAGSYSPLLVSDNYGATFKACGTFDQKNSKYSRQATTLVTTPTHIYMAYDVGISIGDSEAILDIYRIAHAGPIDNSLLYAEPELVYRVDQAGGKPVAGWSSQAGITSDGVIWFTTNSALNYKGQLLTSIDGITWSATYETAAATGGAYGGFVNVMAHTSYYYTGASSGLYYGSATGESTFAWRPYYTDVPVTYQDSAIEKQWWPSSTQVSLLTNGDFEGVQSVVPTSDQDYGTAVTLNETTGPSGVGVFAGTYCGKATLDGSGGYSMLKWNGVLNGSTTQGDEYVFDFRMYIEAVAATFTALAANCTLLAVTGDNNFYVGMTPQRKCFVSEPDAGLAWGSAESNIGDPLIPFNEWFWLRVIIKKHATTGEITVMINRKIVMRLYGVPTFTTGDYYTVQIGAIVSNWTANLYIDNVNFWRIPAASVVPKIEGGTF